MKNTLLSQAIKLAIITPVGVGITLPAAAQDTALEEITVTGSRITRTDLESVTPLAIVSNEEFVMSGLVNIEQKLNELPSILPSFGPSSNNPGDGTARVDLRGLGDTRTLVLVNGRRYIPATQSGVVDLNSIPGTLLKQVDVVTGGASAVYGSDALAGVVNFQLIDDFEGVAINGLYDITTEGDAEKYNFDITLGGNFAGGKGNAVVFASYTSRESLFQGDRDFSRFALQDSAPAGTPGQDGSTGVGGPLSAGGSSGTPGTRLFSGPTVDPDGIPGNADDFVLGSFDSNGGGLPWVEPDSRFNYAPDNYLQLPQERYLVHGAAHYDINDKITAYSELTYSSNFVPQELAPTPAFLTLTVNPDSPFFAPSVQAALDTIRSDTNGDGVIDGEDNAELPYIGRRMVENGSRQSEDRRNAFRILLGARGDITDNWGWDAYYSKARLTGNNTLNNDVAASRFEQAALVTDDGLACQDPSGGCVPMNIFGPGNISQAAVDFVNVGASNLTIIDFEVIAATVSGTFDGIGDAGAIGVAFGVERRDDSSSFRPDEFLASGDVLGFNAGLPTVGSFSVTDIFAEIDVPLLDSAPFAESLSLWAAVRASDYSNLSGTVNSYATAINWAPIPEVRLRGGYQRAVRGANVLELFGGNSQGFPGATDPCYNTGTAVGTAPGNPVYDLCLAQGVPAADIGNIAQANVQIEGLFGGNANLTEEVSDTYTLGAVIQPIDNLDITIDYFDIAIEDAISILGGSVSNVLDICFNTLQDPSDPFCQAVSRRPDGNVNQVAVLNENIGFIETKGIDLTVNYGFDMSAGFFNQGSSFDVNFRATFLDTYDIQPVASLPTVNKCAGNWDNTTGRCGRPRPEQKFFTRGTWTNGPLQISMLWRYISEVDFEAIENAGVDAATLSVPKIDAANYVDITGAYEFSDLFRVNLGFRNIFDEKPTFLGSEQNEANTWTEQYDVIGPRVFLSASYSWQ